MSLRRLLCTSRKIPPTTTHPPVVAAGSTSDPPPVEAAGSTSDPPPVEAAGSDTDPDYKRGTITPAEDPDFYVYYKSYNFAREKCLDGTFYKGGTTEADVEKFVTDIAPTIHGVEISETEKKEITNNAVRYALEQFGVLPPN